MFWLTRTVPDIIRLTRRQFNGRDAPVDIIRDHAGCSVCLIGTWETTDDRDDRLKAPKEGKLVLSTKMIHIGGDIQHSLSTSEYTTCLPGKPESFIEWALLHKSQLIYRYIRKHYLQIRNKSRSRHCMMTPSNGNIFNVIGPLCGEFTCHRWITRTMASDAELW